MTNDDTNPTRRGCRSNDLSGAAAGARRRQRGAVPDFVIFCGFAITIVCGVLWIVYSAHKDAPKLRAECEARGGMLISTRSELYTCVGKPPELPASR